MSDIYKLQYNGMTLAYPGLNGYVSFESAPSFKTLTLCASNGGTLTADTITGMPGDTIELAPTYDNYDRGAITATYVATATTGTWVATGILP